MKDAIFNTELQKVEYNGFVIEQNVQGSATIYKDGYIRGFAQSDETKGYNNSIEKAKIRIDNNDLRPPLK